MSWAIFCAHTGPKNNFDQPRCIGKKGQTGNKVVPRHLPTFDFGHDEDALPLFDPILTFFDSFAIYLTDILAAL